MAMSGQGAKEFGGRWNSKGGPVIYTAATQSLAALEILANLASYSLLKRSYSIIRVEFPIELMRSVQVEDLPMNWKNLEHPQLKQIGDQWLANRGTPVLEVPSALIPEECNYLINPLHPDFARIVVREPEPFPFDHRFQKQDSGA